MNAVSSSPCPVPGVGAFRLLACAVWVLGLGQLIAATSAKDYPGKYSSETLSVEVNLGTEPVTGTIRLGGQAFPMTAREIDGRLQGSFRNGSDEFKFQAELQGATLTLTTDGTSYKLTKQSAPGAPNPLAKPAAANPLARPSAQAADPARPVSGATAASQSDPSGGPAHGPAWKTFRHPTGLSMNYPPDWRLNELASALQLIPPDPGANADGPTEAYLVVAEGAQVTTLEDPRVLQFLDAQVAQLAPFLRRTGPGEKIKAASAPGLLVTWEGTNPKGMSVRAHAFATLLKGFGVVLFAIGDKEQIGRRDRTLRTVFASFAAGEGEKDRQVVGAWRFWSYSSSATGEHSTESSRLLVLRPDGACTWSSRTDTSGSFKGKDSGGNESWNAGYAGTGGNADKGTWSAANGKLFVMWQDGSLSDWGYQVTGTPGNRRLFLKGKQDKPDEWVEAN